MNITTRRKGGVGRVVQRGAAAARDRCGRAAQSIFPAERRAHVRVYKTEKWRAASPAAAGRANEGHGRQRGGGASHAWSGATSGARGVRLGDGAAEQSCARRRINKGILGEGGGVSVFISNFSLGGGGAPRIVEPSDIEQRVDRLLRVDGVSGGVDKRLLLREHQLIEHGERSGCSVRVGGKVGERKLVRLWRN